MTNSKAPPVTSAVANVLSLGNGMWIDVDSTGTLTFFSSTGVKLLQINSSGVLTIYNSSGVAKFQFNSSGSQTSILNGLTLAGQGTPAILGAGAQTLYTNVAPTTLSVTPASAAGTYRMHGMLDILTGGTLTFAVIIGYTDPGGNTRTDVPVFIQQNSTSLVAGGPSANSTGRFTFTYDFATDNSGTAITIGDNSGTYTAGTYYWVPILERIV